MKRVLRYATMGALGLFLCGCILTSSPDPDTSIVLTKGEQVTLEVSTLFGQNQWMLSSGGADPVEISGATGSSYVFDSTNRATGTYAVVLVNTMQNSIESSTWTITVTEAGTTCTDADHDGYDVEGGDCGPIDCNDNNTSVHPGATESGVEDAVCSDGVDNDCDGLVDDQEAGCQSVTPTCTDADNDGYAVEGGDCGEIDCNDGDASIHPGATESGVEDAVCSDDVDNDCDGLVDEQEAGCQSVADDCSPTPSGDDYKDRFLTMWCELHDTDNGYFSPEGVPYHSIETLIIEAPDHGHETTSEAISYWLWLEAEYGKLTGDWSYLQTAWTTMETYIIPTHADQPTNSFHNVSSPATYAGEWPLPSDYPSPLDNSVPVGQDPIGQELANTYDTWDIYGMHWLLDVDNTYGYGRRGDGTSAPSYINTFQRGEQESVWETVPHPSWESFGWGGSNGFLDLFIGDGSYARQWRYTNAPDADARVVQAIFWAKRTADANGGSAVVDALAAKAAKMGDYLRYCLFDKYFKEIGCESLNCPGMSGKDSAHYLLSWYYAWGGATDTNAGWTFRIGCSHNHFGYQNPLAAWVLSTQSAFVPQSPTAQDDWDKSLQRQLEFYRWLQSPQGAIAGGATNSVNGNYSSHPSGVSTFYGMAYDDHPVYHDPGSNTWFGWQAWSMERVAEYYYMTGDSLAEQILDDWVPFAVANVNLTGDDFTIPSEMEWSGQPDTWNGISSFTGNPGLSVTVKSTGQDLGIAAGLAKTLAYYSAGKREHTGTEDAQTRNLAFALMDRMWAKYRDDKGVSVTETRDDYERMDDPVYIPSGWTGTMANGDAINSSSTFLSIRSFYKDDPMYDDVRQALNQGKAPSFNYHRFWAQTEVALANAALSELF